jgi:hypothetical protein
MESLHRQSSLRPVERVTDQLETPSLDDREYRVILLANKLEALLVHDPETDKASASLDVNVGHFSDEDEMPGMAHAVEHVSPPALPLPCPSVLVVDFRPPPLLCFISLFGSLCYYS